METSLLIRNDLEYKLNNIIYPSHPEIKIDISQLNLEELKRIYDDAINYMNSYRDDENRKARLVLHLILTEAILVKLGNVNVSGITKQTIGYDPTSIKLLTLMDELTGKYDTMNAFNQRLSMDNNLWISNKYYVVKISLKISMIL